MKAYIVSLGCPKNLVDAEAATTLLRGSGCTMTEDPADADLLMVNACSFLDVSWRETIEEVNRLAAYKSDGGAQRLILMGCLPRHHNGDLVAELPQVDHFLPTGAHGELPSLVASWTRAEDVPRTIDATAVDRFAGFEERELLTASHSAYVKVAEGCNRSCAFCAIPLIRGRQVVRSPDSIVKEVEGLVARGVREVTLLSQDIVSYRSGRVRFPDLVERIAATGVDWVRIFYLHPAGLTVEDIAVLFSHPNVCRYLEMPIQHVSTRLLANMKRGYDRTHVQELLLGIRDRFPDTVIRSEVIVGFPGETDGDYEELASFVEEFAFDSLGVFPYSREPGTVAASHAESVVSSEIARRAEELITLQEAVSFGARTRFAGQTLSVLVDRELNNGDDPNFGFAGRFYGQAPEIDGEVFIRGEELTVGDFADVCVTDTAAYDLEAVAVGPMTPPVMEE